MGVSLMCVAVYVCHLGTPIGAIRLVVNGVVCVDAAVPMSLVFSQRNKELLLFSRTTNMVRHCTLFVSSFPRQNLFSSNHLIKVYPLFEVRTY